MAMTPRQIAVRLYMKERVRRADLAYLASVTATATHGTQKQIDKMMKDLT